ncbi:MAG TPA: biotin carboxylase N-terminal domain-containing protein [Candidatus Binatia bacterium]|nr:biotin carboxylase N-terminal domain-containing protein [Candidatus Binatia bacterium]
MFRRVLIANRGEVAVRIIRACRELGVTAVAAHSTADRDALHVRLADEKICIGPPRAEESYLSIPAVVSAALATRADAVHPGYGFLAENGDLADALRHSGVAFVGPRARHLRLMGDKARARRFMARAGLSVLPGTERAVDDRSELGEMAAAIGYPVVVKAVAGGGGRGLRVVERPADLPAAVALARREAMTAFGDARVFLERWMGDARHVEVQVLGDRHGRVAVLGERDCSVQRRHQKLLEEAPAPGLSPTLRGALHEAALAGARALRYHGLGTLEFLVAPDGTFHFIEMNPRLQVEHTVTEAVTGVDLVVEGLRLAAGLPLELAESGVPPVGHAFQCRIYAEGAAPERGRPRTVGRLDPPGGPGIRVDLGAATGEAVPSHYDPLLAKLVAHGPTRDHALRRLRAALDDFRIDGTATTIPLHRRIVRDPSFVAGGISIGHAGSLIAEGGG